MKINCSNAQFVPIDLNKKLISINTKNMFMRAMQLTNINFVMKNLMEKEFNRHIESVHEGNKLYERNLQNVTFVVNDFS